jgi:hypothetical protein
MMWTQGSFTDTDRGNGIRQAIFKFSGTLGFHFFQESQTVYPTFCLDWADCQRFMSVIRPKKVLFSTPGAT